ncbi:unnamed protein product [Effrenium voratum]|uniref:Fibronectin type-III domain-containing protein n=1 Tax=Effrenium voratum TaxID=2562239 RepID=A0AA36N9B1_9DINO|nr:unnamed protein product [Effrenium voratum]CAJ1438169.1 unnamed protein product [Effrenium voratum]
MPTCFQHFCAEWRRARRVLQVHSLDLETRRELASVLAADHVVGCDGPLSEKYGIGFWHADFDESASARIWLAQTGTHAVSNDEVETNDGDAEHELIAKDKLRNRSGVLSAMKGFAGRMRKLDVERESTFSWSQAVANIPKVVPLEQTLLFRNPEHPMATFPEECSKEEFVALMKKSLVAERLFAEGVGPSQKNDEQPIAYTHDAEDLYEALLIHQQICRRTTSPTLQLGRVMDELVKRWTILTKFRQLIERDTATISTFIQTYFVIPKVKHIDSTEIYHFFRGGSGGPGPRDISVEEVLSALDEDGDAKVDLQECQRQLGLISPPRPSLMELGSQLELKHGLGRSAISGPLSNPAALFEHLCTVEKVSPPPEDVARLFRALNAGKGNKEISTESLSHLLRQPPLEVQWGVEVHTIPALYDALACRMLTMERSRQKEAILPAEAFVQGDVPDRSELARRFGQLWDTYASSLVGGVSSQTAAKYRDHCYHRYEAHADQIAIWRSNHSGELRRGQMVSVHKSLFPSIGDVITTASCRLVAGQTCIVRYRLQGVCSYFGPGHTVMKDEREPVPWPVPRKVLGDTPFIALVPPGLSYCAAGGGGFYLGHQAFNNVDPNLRADLPKSSDGQPQLLGHVEMSMPSLIRASRGTGKASKSQNFELRLFCSSKQRIIGCIGEPVRLTVWNQNPPPPLESLQIRCEGRNVTLRWNALDLSDLPKESQPDNLRVLLKTSNMEDTIVLKPEVTEHEFQDLTPDTEYEFRVRAENVAGSGRDVVAHCRINASCPAPHQLIAASIGTAQVELEFTRPSKIGNEATKDAFQIKAEAIQKYVATLRVVDEVQVETRPEGSEASSPRSVSRSDTSRSVSVKKATKEKPKRDASEDHSRERHCQWEPSSVTEDKARGMIQATLPGLRPDTRYSLAGLCAVNSVGAGACCPTLEFWTIPLIPRVERVRVRQGQVLLALSETGGSFVHNYEVSILKEGVPETDEVTWTVPQTTLISDADGEKEVIVPQPELPLPFSEMPVAESAQKHHLRLRACNAGGWSEWSQFFSTVSISRQQGADLAEAAIVEAISSPSIEQLEQVLRASKGIEFQDYKYVHEAKALLLRLREVKNALAEAMKARNPDQLREALQAAVEAKLQGVDKAIALLEKLDSVVERLDTAKGLAPLKEAIQAAETARLPEDIVIVARERLEQREAAQEGLERAMEAARVPDLLEALKVAEGMDLPAEPEARERVELLGQTQDALQKAMNTKVIPDLSAALTLASKAGLKEHQMIHEARALLTKLMNRRETVKKELEKAVKFRHPGKLKMTIMSARLAQVSLKRIVDAENVRKKVEELLEAMTDAAGIEQREETLKAAVEYSIPAELLKKFEIELEELKNLHAAIRQGDPEGLRECIEKCEELGIKVVELLEARVLYRDWAAACEKIDVEATVERVEQLRSALKAAKDLGVNALVLTKGNDALRHLERRIKTEQELAEAVHMRKLEVIAHCTKQACDAGAHDHPLVTRAHGLLEVLQTKRDRLGAASDRAELHLLNETLDLAVAAPALPDSETSAAFGKLRALRKKEQIQLAAGLRAAKEAKDFRTGGALLARVRRAKEVDVEVEPEYMANTEWMRIAEIEQREGFEKDILEEKAASKMLAAVDKAPAPEPLATFVLPNSVIVGSMKVLFEPAGSQICILPREIVEATLVVNLETGLGALDISRAVSPRELQRMEGEAIIQQCLGVIRKLIGSGDEVRCLRDIQYVSWDPGETTKPLRGSLQMPVALYIRRDHRGLEVAAAICKRCHVGADLWQSVWTLPTGKTGPLDLCTMPDSETEDCSMKLRREDADDISASLSEDLASSLVYSARNRAQLSAKQLADYTRSVRARVLRAVHVEFNWTYPKGIFDSLTASCVLFDQEKALDIIDDHGSQAFKYNIVGTGPYGPARAHSARDRIRSASDAKVRISPVSSLGEVSNATIRQGKQTLEVRLDMVPPSVSDLLFVISPTDSRDLSKFTALQCTLVDAESGEIFADVLGEQAQTGDECAVLLSIYRLDDGLWHVNKINSFGAGSHRDYRGILAKLLHLGYPRNVAMKNLVPPVLGCIQKELDIDHPVKETLVHVTDKHALEMGYAVELTGDEKNDTPRMLEHLAGMTFPRAVAQMLHETTVQRISDRQLTLNQASFGDAWKLGFDFSWTFPVPEQEDEEDPTNYYLDATCVVFEGQALRELVDYRGAHGVRWVMNGVLDYRGYWVGQMPIGDASGGAVHHAGGSMNYAAREGKTSMQVEFQKLPEGVTDVFLVLSSHTTPMSQFSDITLQVKDVDHPGHRVSDVFELVPSVEKDSALVVCRCSRTGMTMAEEPIWSLEMLSVSAGGHAMDYRPVLQSLYAIQAATRSGRHIQWPCKGVSQRRPSIQDKLPRLPTARLPSPAEGEELTFVHPGTAPPTPRPGILPPISARPRFTREGQQAD